jgi:hypothetical protein
MIETPAANLAKGMRQLNGVYTQWSNRRHQRSGHLFQGRYKAVLVDWDGYFLDLGPLCGAQSGEGLCGQASQGLGMEQLRRHGRKSKEPGARRTTSSLQDGQLVLIRIGSSSYFPEAIRSDSARRQAW